ncbi:hypothetical protein A3E39_04550 [Candidatus Uhrbacteria bacterium RIFCSPHIGHO2_12_FULL_60_25]|uniref:Uncharacterized protein n=1 Tax=Candidatus Uhrbacteria bacterium RIFCSPHIGHO2_12_FULL_60_25 TaxID=1802399 RepID=A0A1F7UMB7_9BACT|nr:MAG: hypothetical protein A3D73_04225 [Candidatus Uhrbacteria bacterium RIFCSPHIGHO2_02_FULL_60_44]OGL79399.1 MAG: hypothetical protein A3E39_04550 [Candidatus Uhrbacteria bacterium RIFCSPHIGHO2_12_FULL_60_25]
MPTAIFPPFDREPEGEMTSDDFLEAYTDAWLSHDQLFGSLAGHLVDPDTCDACRRMQRDLDKIRPGKHR